MTRVLVTASSRHGSTQEIADAIATGLKQRGLEAEVRSLDDLDGPDGYDAVVLGSAVYMGHWLGPARSFVEQNAAALSSMPVWLFSSGPLGPRDHLVPLGEPADATAVAERIGARDHVVFAGRIDHDSLNLRERVTVRMVHAPETDCRDWGAVDGYSAAIAADLA